MAELSVKGFDHKLHIIHLSGEVDDEMFRSLNEKIVDIANADNEVIYENSNVLAALGIEGYINKPKITIYLNTHGGYCYDGLAIYDLLKDLQKDYEVDIVCTGKIMSMGVIILLAVDKKHRFSTPNATFMIHQAASMTMGKIQEMKDELEEAERLDNKLSDIIINETKITKKQLKDIHDRKKDWFFGADEALRLQLVSEVV